MRRADAPWLAGVVVVGGVLGPLLLTLGLVRADAASASLLLNLESLATMAIAWLARLREHGSAVCCSGALAIVAGALVVGVAGPWRLPSSRGRS